MEPTDPIEVYGKAKEWTDAELDKLAAVDDSAIERARDTWREIAPNLFKTILDEAGPWTFDQQTQTWWREGRRKKKEDALLLAWLAMSAAEESARQAAERLTAGKGSIGSWQKNLAGDIRDLYIIAAMLAAGGAAGLDDSIRADVAEITRENLVRLRDFAKGIESEEVTMAPAIEARAQQYPGAAHQVFEEAKRASHVKARDDAGKPIYLSERNRLDDLAEHCHTTADSIGCPELTRAGWQLIGTLVPPGLRTCKGGCRCVMQYSTLVPDEAQQQIP